MAVVKTAMIPELWSESLIDAYKHNLTINMSSRSYGTRLLRAAAKGEDWTKIKKEEKPHDRYTDDAADALAYQLDADILKQLRNGK